MPDFRNRLTEVVTPWGFTQEEVDKALEKWAEGHDVRDTIEYTVRAPTEREHAEFIRAATQQSAVLSPVGRKLRIFVYVESVKHMSVPARVLVIRCAGERANKANLRRALKEPAKPNWMR